jgi:hypothetical protein
VWKQPSLGADESLLRNQSPLASGLRYAPSDDVGRCHGTLRIVGMSHEQPNRSEGQGRISPDKWNEKGALEETEA